MLILCGFGSPPRFEPLSPRPTSNVSAAKGTLYHSCATSRSLLLKHVEWSLKVRPMKSQSVIKIVLECFWSRSRCGSRPLSFKNVNVSGSNKLNCFPPHLIHFWGLSGTRKEHPRRRQLRSSTLSSRIKFKKPGGPGFRGIVATAMAILYQFG